MRAHAVLLLTLLVVAAPAPAAAQDAVTTVGMLLAAWHEDPARIDRARALLAELYGRGRVTPAPQQSP